MTEPRKRGRPKGAHYNIQKHIFLDAETADQLRELAPDNESRWIRELIRREFTIQKTVSKQLPRF